MTSTIMGRRQARLEKMFAECQQTVLSQICLLYTSDAADE